MTTDKITYAEDVNYWQTGKAAADTWLDNAESEITRIGGKIIRRASGMENLDGVQREVFMLEFAISNDCFKVIWPVLQPKKGLRRSARIQAATALYHDVKAKCVSAKFHGIRAAFFQHLLLPDGRTAGQIAAPELVALTPSFLALPNGKEG